MSNNPIIRKVDAFFSRTERKLVFALAHLLGLAFLIIRGEYVAALCLHAAVVFLICLARFGSDFIWTFFFPEVFLVVLLSHYRAKKYVARFKQNTPTEVVIILGWSDWLTYKAWTKPNYFRHELKALVEYLTKKGQDFSFYPRATVEDVKEIMRNSAIKEVYFFGHGDSHTFCLGTHELLYYCDFKCEGYRKEYVHQVHCGTKDGTPLMKYVVPEEHWPGCFFFQEEINGEQIIKEFKRKAKEFDRPSTKKTN